MKISLFYPAKTEKMIEAVRELSELETVSEIAVLHGLIPTSGENVANGKVKVYGLAKDFISGSDVVFVNIGAEEIPEEKTIMEKYKCANGGDCFLHVFKALRKLDKAREIFIELEKLDKKPLVFALGCCSAEVIGYLTKTGAQTIGITGYDENAIASSLKPDLKGARVTLAGTTDNLWLTNIEDSSGKTLLGEVITAARGGKLAISLEQSETLSAFGQLKAEKTCCCQKGHQSLKSIIEALGGKKEIYSIFASGNESGIIEGISPSGVVVTQATINSDGVKFSKKSIALAARCLSLLEVGVQINTARAGMTALCNDIFIALALDNVINKQFSLDDIRKIANEMLNANKNVGSLVNFH